MNCAADGIPAGRRRSSCSIGAAPTDDAHKELTPRQIDIVRLLVAGLSAKEIAARLGLSVRTVEFHSYSFAGPGPINTVYGPVQLSLPITSLPFTADTNGEVHQAIPLPPGLSGRPIWTQAVDLSSGSLSNALAQFIG